MSDEEKIASKFRRLVELRERRDEAKQAADDAEGEYRAYERELFEEMDESPIEGTRKINLGGDYGVVHFTPRTTNYGRIIDLDACLEFFEQRGGVAGLTKTDVVKRRLNELVRERLERGDSMPPGVDWYASRGITISKKGS